MNKTLFTAVLCTMFLAVAANADWMSRYWDGCKPSCSWSGKPTAPGMGQCKECNRQDNLMSTSDDNKSACDGGGTSYTCWDMSPVVSADPNVGYGFVASNPSKMSCGSCYELTFNGQGEHGTGPSHQALVGKKMIVMASNIGGDVKNDQFDLLVPGGGVGQFDAFSNQIGKSKSDLGVQYGGLLSDCANHNAASVSANQSCLKGKCAQVFSGQPKLKAGCDFYADFLMAANNPKFTSRSVDCPDYLKTAYRQASPNSPGGPPINPTTYALTVNAGTGGTATGGGSYEAGISVNPRATPGSGYVFDKWTATGNAPSGVNNSTNANLTFNMPANALTLQAAFKTAPAQTYTLTVNRNNSNYGNVTGGGNFTSGQNVSVTATANSGYRFVNWTAQGNAPGGVNGSTNANLSFNMPGNALTLVANFESNTVVPPDNNDRTLTLNAQSGGTVSGGGNYASGAWVTATANANANYTFTGWEATQGTIPQGVNAGNLSISFNMPNSNLTLRANFTQNSNGGGDRTDTTKFEAELYTAKNGDNIQVGGIEDAGGGSCIGYINNGDSVTYYVSRERAGAYTLVFRIASEQSINFSVSVNGQSAGSINRGGTGGWNTYLFEKLASDVQLNAGDNTIILTFGGAVNVDYFLVLGQPRTTGVIYSWKDGNGAVKTAQPRAAAVTLYVSPKGFSAALPPSHAYTSYKLIDMRGREVRSGKINQSVTDLRFDNLKRGVLFLKLESKGNSPEVVRAVTY